MHCSGPLPLTFEGPEQGFGGKNYQNGSRENFVEKKKMQILIYLDIRQGLVLLSPAKQPQKSGKIELGFGIVFRGKTQCT